MCRIVHTPVGNARRSVDRRLGAATARTCFGQMFGQFCQLKSLHYPRFQAKGNPLHSRNIPTRPCSKRLVRPCNTDERRRNVSEEISLNKSWTYSLNSHAQKPLLISKACSLALSTNTKCQNAQLLGPESLRSKLFSLRIQSGATSFDPLNVFCDVGVCKQMTFAMCVCVCVQGCGVCVCKRCVCECVCSEPARS